MTNWSFVGLMVVAGALIAFQSPINAALARGVGVLEASFVSFVIGALVATVVVAFFGKGHLSEVAQVPWWQLVGGALGMIYVTLIVVSVARIGVTAVMVAGLVGQLSTAMIIDHYGWFGVVTRPINAVTPILATLTTISVT